MAQIVHFRSKNGGTQNKSIFIQQVFVSIFCHYTQFYEPFGKSHTFAMKM